MEKVSANGAKIRGYEEISLSGGFLCSPLALALPLPLAKPLEEKPVEEKTSELRWFLRKLRSSKD
jgi:hypothetical protein